MSASAGVRRPEVRAVVDQRREATERVRRVDGNGVPKGLEERDVRAGVAVGHAAVPVEVAALQRGIDDRDLDRQWLAESPVLIATSAADGSCDVSPKGDPRGFTLVLDDTTIVIPERPGNKRVDGFLNILSNPHVGLIFVIPGRGDTLRINGRATIVRDAPFFDLLTVKGHRPKLALVVEIEEIFHHCSKAFLRSDLWKPETWQDGALPSRARIAKALERPEDPIEELERYYGPDYAKGLYAG